jgi:hypothetical protein
LVLEDVLAKNWLQGQLKNNGLIFDHPFNAEILRVDAKGLFTVLEQLFDARETKIFKDMYGKLEAEKKSELLREGFIRYAKTFALEAAKKAGGAVLTYYGLFT